ncbi:MAG: hypothetical protein OEW15_16490 [Nitrospirota bacterium]|nr:hypothetical protein [Nitrospirota bacterium]
MNRILAMAVTAGLLVPALAGAQQKAAIDLRTLSQVEVTTTNAKGEKEMKRVEAARANVTPGDMVIFTTSYSSNVKKPAENVAITNPVPEHMVYVDRSAEGAGTRIEFSIDGGKTYSAPEKLIVTVGPGKTRPALAADYTHIKWTLTKPLQPGGKGSVSFRAKVK